jgi:hypothetical protein
MFWRSICQYAAIAIATIIQQQPTFADDTQVLESISAFAKQNCEEVNQSGDATSENIKGKVDAGVSGLFKTFASADGQAEIDRDTRKYTGLIQNELASSLKDVRACKRHVIDLLVPRLLKGTQTDPPKPRFDTTPPQRVDGALGPGSPPAALLSDPNKVEAKERIQIYSHVFALYGCGLVGSYINCFLTHTDIGGTSGDVTLWNWVGSGVRFIDQSGYPHQLDHAAWLIGHDEQLTMPVLRNHALWFILTFDAGKQSVASGTLQLKILGDNKTMEVVIANQP